MLHAVGRVPNRWQRPVLTCRRSGTPRPARPASASSTLGELGADLAPILRGRSASPAADRPVPVRNSIGRRPDVESRPSPSSLSAGRVTMILVLGVWTFLGALLGGATAIARTNVALRHQVMVLPRSSRPQPRQQNPEDPIHLRQPWPWLAPSIRRFVGEVRGSPAPIRGACEQLIAVPQM